MSIIAHMTQDVSHMGRVPVWTMADRLRKAREDTGLGQAEWASEIGISRRSVTNYESGSPVRRPVLLAWAMASGVRLEWLTGENEPEGTPGSSVNNHRFTPLPGLRKAPRGTQFASIVTLTTRLADAA